MPSSDNIVDLDEEEKLFKKPWDASSAVSNGSDQQSLTKYEKRTSKHAKSAKSFKQTEKTVSFKGDFSDFMNNVASWDPKENSDRTIGMFENYLSHVTSMYFGMSDPSSKLGLNDVSGRLNLQTTTQPIGMDVDTSGQPNEQQGLIPSTFYFSTLDMLWNPIRVPHVFENWSPREIAIFETCICKFGK